MGVHTKIEWTDSSLSLEVGCQGCELWNPAIGEKTCYAGNLVERYAGLKGWPESFDKPKLFPERLIEAERWKDLRGTNRADKPWLNGMPRLIFLDDLGDTFTESLPIDWLTPYLERMSKMPVIWQVLTKRANRMLEFSKTHPFPKNFWLLTSVTSAANYNRVEQLMEVRGGSVKGISYEPAWGPVSFAKWFPRKMALSEIPGWALNDGCTEGIKGITNGLWIISGGSSGATAKPSNPQWFRDVRDECIKAKMPYFHKQNGEWSPDGEIVKISAHRWKPDSFAWGKNGEKYNPVDPDPDDFPQVVMRVGKKAAGRLLDGREWNEMPEVR